MSKDKKRLVPVRRFKEFENAPAWEQRRLGDLVTFYSGLTYSPKDVRDSGTLVLRSSNVKNGEIVNADNVYVLDSVVNSNNVENGDVIVVVRNGSRSLIGKHALVKRNMKRTVIGAFMTGIRSENPNFINALLDTRQFNSEINKNLGATINQITTGSFKKMKFMVAYNTDEQEKIGAFFKQLDSLIVLHQRKLDKLKRVKSAYLTEMFPAEGEREPKRRFPGFTVAWEQRKLGEITKTHSFKQYISEAFDHGKYMVIQQGENPIAGYANGDPFENFKDVTLFGDHTLSLFKPQEKFFVASDGIKILSPSLKMNGMFYYYLLEKYRPQSEGYKRHFTIMKKSTALFPIEIDEQIKISNFLEELDSLIALHQRKLDKLKKMKAAYLEEMFV